MRFIIEKSIYDTEKSDKILEFKRKFEEKCGFGNLEFSIYPYRDTTLYKTKKGNWFLVVKGDHDEMKAQKETDNSVRKIFFNLNRIDLYEKYFEKLEEA